MNLKIPSPKFWQPIFMIAVAVLALVAMTSAILANGTTKVDMIRDVNDGSTEPRDMTGPDGFGSVAWNQGKNGDLHIVAKLGGAAPSSTYRLSFYCGPSHNNSIGSIAWGTIYTADNGQGNTNLIIPAAALVFGECAGSGDKTGHLDLDAGSPIAKGTYVAAGITFTAP